MNSGSHRRYYAADNSIGSTIEGSSFSGLLTASRSATSGSLVSQLKEHGDPWRLSDEARKEARRQRRRLVIVGGRLKPIGERITLPDLAGKPFKAAILARDGFEVVGLAHSPI